MRILFVPAVALILVGAGEPPQSALDNPVYEAPQERWETVEDAQGQPSVLIPGRETNDTESCTDAITEAREATDQPPLLEREPASPDRPLAIYAVDRKQDGCSVMVMMGNREDIRPLPLPVEGPHRVIPAQADADGE
ncbi:MAG: hypothetical protein ACX930_01525 [Erythrobacter sp.]